MGMASGERQKAMKQILGLIQGDNDGQKSRVKYKGDVKFIPIAKHLVSMNAFPGVKEKTERNNPNKGTPGDKAKARAEEKAEKAAAAEEAAKAPVEEPEVVEEAPAEEAPAEEAAAEDAKAE